MRSYSVLLGFLIVFLVIVPLLEKSFLGALITQIGLTFLYVNCLVANRQARLLFRIGVGVGVAALLLSWIEHVLSYSIGASEYVTHFHILKTFDHMVTVLFFLIMAVMILMNVLGKHIATAKSVIGAICVYLILGLAWAMMYRTVELIQVDPLFNDNREIAVEQAGHKLTAFSQLVYFSFVTMSTLGYGDITPRTSVTQTLTWMQSVLGQFYIAVLVAWLVSALPKSRSSSAAKKPEQEATQSAED